MNMNTPTEWQTTATVTNPERRAFWESIFGTAILPILSFIPVRVNVPGHPNTLAYMLDLRLISPEQRKRLIRALSKNFNVPLAEVEATLDARGVPVLADDVSVSSSNQGLFFSALDDNDARSERRAQMLHEQDDWIDDDDGTYDYSNIPEDRET